jgi:signal transduction protein with GAF and PtsI domain
MKCRQCHSVFAVMGEALNSQTESTEMLERTARVLVAEFDLKACHFRLLSRDRKVLENIASYGLSERFLAKGPVDAERSVTQALEGEIVMVNDCAEDDRIQYPEEMKREGIVSMLTLPLVVRGQVIGVMRLATAERRLFDDDEIEFFRVAALFCASAIIHSLFHEILEDVNEAISGNLNLAQVLEAIVRVVADRLRAKGCSIRLLDAKGRNLQLKASHGLSRRHIETASAHPGCGVEEALKGNCVSIFDAPRDERVRHHEEMTREGISSILLVPVICRESALGVLSLYTHRPYRFSDEEIQLMRAVGGQCALAIRNAQMYTALKKRYDAATTDFQEWFDRYGVYGTRPGGLSPTANEH